MAAGVVIGYAAWLAPETISLILFLPVAASFAKRRLEVAALMIGYFGIGNIELPHMVARFFAHPSPLIEFGAPVALTLLTSLPFLLYAPRAKPWLRGATYIAALAVLTLPPVGLFAWRNPLLVAGELYPGAKVLGLVLASLLLGSIAAMRGAQGAPRARALVPLALLVAAGWFLFAGPHANYRVTFGPTLNWAAADTHLIPETTAHADTLRTEKTVAAITDISTLPWVTVIILPESAVSPYRPVDELLMIEASTKALRQKRALVFGAVIVSPDGKTWQDAIMGAGTLAAPDGAPRVLHEAIIPMPVGNWHLGFPGGAPLRMFASDAGNVDGTPVAWSLCYEDTLVWPHRYLLTGNPRALVSVANDWALAGTRAARAQQISVTLLARLAGVPLVRAVNG